MKESFHASTSGEKVNTQLCWPVLLVSLLSLLLVNYLDYLTGYEFLFFVFYFFPVGLCGWFLGWSSTLAMAVLCGVSWFVVDKLSGHAYPHEGIRYWNSGICFLAFGLIGLTLYRLRRVLEERARAQQKLAHALEDLSRSTEEIRKLQSDLQVVCAWTKQIRVDGQWMPIDQFLSDRLHIAISHGISPEAMERIQKSLAEEPPGGGNLQPKGQG